MSIQGQIPRCQRRRLQRILRKTRCRITALRCRVLLLLHAGQCVAAVAACVDCVRATVYRTVYRYETLGEDSVIDQRTLRTPAKVTPALAQRLLSYLDESPKQYGWHRSGWTAELLSRQLQADTQVTLSGSSIRRVLRSLGCRRGRPRPALQIPIKGRRKVLQNIARVVARASAEEEVFYQDEADVHLNPKLGMAYMKRGQQLVVLTPGKNVKRYLFGALNARTGRVIHSISDTKNSVAFVESLKYLQAAYRRARVLHLVLDNDVIHKSSVVQRYLATATNRVVLHFLPPYSPNDNPIERLWKQLHDHVTRNHRHPTIDSLLADVVVFLKHVQPFPGTQVSTLRLAA